MTNSRVLRTLHLVNRVNDRGDGIANVCVDLACEQARRGLPVALAAADGGFVDLCVSDGVQYFPIELRWRTPVDVLRSIAALRQVIAAFAPDIIHAHTMRAVVVAFFARRAGGPRVVATVHNEYQRGAFLMGLADKVVGVSSAVSQAMEKRRIPSRKMATVTNGIIGSARRRVNEPDSTVLLAPQSIVAIGAVSERKGVDVLVDAFNVIAGSFPELNLYFVGNIDWAEAPRRAAQSIASKRIHFLGFHSNPGIFLRQATVFALASRRDPFPLVLLEALEAAVPIVATAVDGVPEALANGVAGILVPPNSPVELAAAIKRLLESRDLRATYSAAAAVRSVNYSVSKMADGYSSVYSSAVKCRAALTQTSVDANEMK